MVPDLFANIELKSTYLSKNNLSFQSLSSKFEESKMILERIEKNQEVMYHFKFYKKHAMSLYLTYSLSKISNYIKRGKGCNIL